MIPDYTALSKRPLTRKQKLLWGIGLAAVLLYFNPGLLRSIAGTFVHAAPQKPSAAIPMPTPTPAQLAAASAAAELAKDSAEFSGKWLGRGLVVGRGTCNVSLEIKTQADKQYPFAGYSNMLCTDLTIPAGTRDPSLAAIITAEKLAPESTVLIGSVEHGTLGYVMQRVVSHGQSKCDLENMDVTPFGDGRIALQWKDSCGSGQMTLARSNY